MVLSDELNWMVVFLVLAVLAITLGFGGLAGSAAPAALLLGGAALTLAVTSFFTSLDHSA